MLTDIDSRRMQVNIQEGKGLKQRKVPLSPLLLKTLRRYISQNNIKGEQKGIINLLSACHTASLGSHYRICNHCGHTDKVYNSCRNRHSPNCQHKDKESWLKKRMEELLPVGYYHFVFTIPHTLNELCFQKVQGKFLDMLKTAYNEGNLSFRGKTGAISCKKTFDAYLRQHCQKSWVVNIQKPFAHPQKVLEYLSSYIFRIAISDRRIEKVENGKVYFTIKDYKQKGIFRRIHIDVNEFIHRFLVHVLPKGFFKVRYYGIFANTHRKTNIAIAKAFLLEEQQEEKQEAIEDGRRSWEKLDTVWEAIMHEIKTPSTTIVQYAKREGCVFQGWQPLRWICPLLQNRYRWNEHTAQDRSLK